MSIRRHASPQSIFGNMLKAAIPRLSIFHSDLYHDAIALHQRITPPDAMGYIAMPCPFLWFVGPTGTSLYWLDRAKQYGGFKEVELLAESYPAIYFYDGYTIAPIGLVDAIGAVRAVQSLAEA